MEMKINGIDAMTLGVRMGDKFLNVIGAPAPLKNLIENKSGNIHGKQVLFPAEPKLDERDVTLQFVIEGINENDYLTKKKAFEKLLYKGKVIIFIPVNNETYRLTYSRSQDYAQNILRTSCKMSVKFNESNPNDRLNE